MANATDIRQGTIIRIVDDDDDIRDALGFMLECKGWQVRAYASARDFLTQDSPSIPGCLLLDIRMPDMSGVQLQTLMKEQRIQLPIIFITGHADVETAVATLKAGGLEHSCGQLSPENVTEVLLEMSPREKEITQLLLLGVSNKEIAERLSLSQRTVHGHRNNVYRKLRVHNLHDFLQCVRGADLSILS